jgi:hypothetical protein
MKQLVLAGMIALGLAAPAHAGSGDFEKILGGFIVGAIVVDALKHNPPHTHPQPVRQPPPVVYYDQPDPYRVCRQEVEYRRNWIYLYEINCYGEIIHVTKTYRY